MKAVTLALAVLCGVAVSQMPVAAQQQPAAGNDKRTKAAKIAGLVGFVNVSCPELRTDDERFKAALSSMGVTLEELDQGELFLKARSYVDAYNKDVPANCKRAAEMFGETGRVVPGLVLPK